MATAQQHYDALLAPIYVWMAGGIEAALATGAQDIAAWVPGEGTAIDLGAGFGMHALPLAHGGYDVVAIDSSALLLDALRAQSAGLAVRAVEADLLDFRRHVATPASLIVCLGDTLTHLPELADVERLCGDIAASLRPGGHAVLTFRDYSQPATGVRRFIPVRSDTERILTCFIEEQPGHVLVHDIVHERIGDSWRIQVSSYPKLRLAPATVAGWLRAAGLSAEAAAGPRGMVRLTAGRPAI